VHLVDTAPTGVRQINSRGVVHDGVEYPLDVLIYATGFEWMGTGSFNMIRGRDGQTLRDKWQTAGTKTFLGIHSAGFPNLFIMNGPQGGGGGQFNFTRVSEMHANYVVWVLEMMRDRGALCIDVEQQVEDEYAEHCAEMDLLSAPLRDCLSYYNADCRARPGSLAYYGGGQRWHERRMATQESMTPYIIEEAED
jgi:cyclohexanone monooxygenase